MKKRKQRKGRGYIKGKIVTPDSDKSDKVLKVMISPQNISSSFQKTIN